MGNGQRASEWRALDSRPHRLKHAAGSAKAIALSDYRKGVVTPQVIAAAVASAAGVPVVVDPKVPEARRYVGVTVLTPNHHEAELMNGTRIRTPDDARQAARALHAATRANILITWGCARDVAAG